MSASRSRCYRWVGHSRAEVADSLHRALGLEAGGLEERRRACAGQLAGKDAQCITKMVCEECPAGGAKANGEAEAAVQVIKWRIRAIILMLERKFGKPVLEGHPMLSWVPRYAAEQANRFRVGVDGKTPEERRTGEKWRSGTACGSSRRLMGKVMLDRRVRALELYG